MSSRLRNVGLATVCAVVPLVRYASGASLARGIYAEDGAVFLRDALETPRSLIFSYAGYGHFLPRVFALAAAQLPIAGYPALVVAFCTAVVGVSGLVVAYAADRLGLSGVAKAIAVLALVALPGFGNEIIMTLCNLQWVLLYAAAWMLAAKVDRNATFAGLAVVAATSPLVVFLAPVALVGKPTRRWLSKVGACVGVGLAYHAMCILSRSGSLKNPQTRALSVGVSIIRFMVLTSSKTVANFDRRAVSVGWLLVDAAVLLFVVYWCRNRSLSFAFIGSGAALLVFCSTISGGAATRYATTAMALAVAGGAIALADQTRRTRALPWLLALAAVPWVLSPRLAAYREEMPSWRTEIHSARVRCETETERRRAFVASAPRDWGEDRANRWVRIELRCDWL